MAFKGNLWYTTFILIGLGKGLISLDNIVPTKVTAEVNEHGNISESMSNGRGNTSLKACHELSVCHKQAGSVVRLAFNNMTFAQPC